MRTLSAAATTLLTNKRAIKPILLVKVFWSNPKIYGEKHNVEYNVLGKLLSTSTIDDVIDLSGSSNSISLSVVLDDNDGELKNIFNNTNIHGTRVDVLQWFEGFHIDDAFRLFEGKIATPIVYNEKAKTLSFDVINEVENREAGFSIEEGQFSYVPAGAVGKTWPLVFGTVAASPTLNILEPPSGVLAQGMGIVDDIAWEDELNNVRLELDRANQFMISEFTNGLREAYLAAAERTLTQSANQPFGDRTANSHDQAAQGHFRQADQYRQDANLIEAELNRLLAEKREQESYQYGSVRIVNSNLPQNVPLTLKIGEGVFTGTLSGNLFSIGSRTVPQKVNRLSNISLTSNTDTLTTFRSPTTGQKFYWLDGGTQVSALNFPLKYIVSLGHVNVISVRAKQKNVFVKVPTEYYTVIQETFGTLQTTSVILSEPLTSKNDEVTQWESDEIFADVVSPVGPHIVDILVYLIENFTDLTYDVTSFNHVRPFLNNYPANFVLTDRKNTLDLLSEIAFQARCQIWINDRKFFLKYLPEEPTPIDTITEADINDRDEVNIEVTTTETEELVTKFIATWKAEQTQNEPFEIVYRYNVEKFGIKEQVFNFYIFNNIESVKKSAEFWSIQKANLWKRLRFSLFLQKIKLETFDAVTLDFDSPIVANTDVVGVIEKAAYNSESNLIDVEIKVPVRFGEMDKYVYAAPKDVTEKYPKNNDPFIRTGNPFSGVVGDVVGNVLLGEAIVGLNTLTYSGNSAGRDTQIGDQFDDATDFGQVSTFLDPQEIVFQRPTNLLNFSNSFRYSVNTPKPIEKPSTGGTSAYPGFVLERFEGNLYYVSVFLLGLNQPPTTVLVEQFAHPTDDEITVNTPCIVYSGKGTLETTKYIMFVPVWMQQNV